MAPIRLVVGLGNPGPQHRRTRHNVGFWFVDELASRGGSSFRSESKFFGESCEVFLDGVKLRLLKPQTFMNRSGQAVGAFTHFFQLPLESVLVVHDEIDLPPGTLRLKQGGGHGGHNGVRDIVACLGSSEFARLRIGIGHPGHKDDVHDYVLRPPTKEQEEAMLNSLDEALEVWPQIVAGEFAAVMNVLHRRRRSDASDDEATEACDPK